jgi:hypothetical protein
MTGQPDPSDVRTTAAAAHVAGRDAGDAPGLEPSEMHVELAREDHMVAAHIPPLLRDRGWVPELARQLAVRSAQEPVALVFILADEDDEGPMAVREVRVLHHQHRKVS